MQVVFPALLLSVVGVISFQTRSPGNPEQQKATHQSKAKMKGRLSRNPPTTRISDLGRCIYLPST